MCEVLNDNMEKIKASTILERLKLTAKNYFVVSTHREENVDNPDKLKKILDIMNRLADEYKLPVIVSTHPRTRKRLEGFKEYKHNRLIQFLKPFGFSDYVNLQMNAKCTLSDSGTISEESAILSFPAISLRESMERPEAQDVGTIVLTGFDAEVVIDSIATVIDEHGFGRYKHLPDEYKIENTSWRVLKLITGNTKLSNKWWGIV
jgi:UDP-N-acetylglucosamine 2-epimerase (non-hydrolysing)